MILNLKNFQIVDGFGGASNPVYVVQTNEKIVEDVY